MVNRESKSQEYMTRNFSSFILLILFGVFFSNCSNSYLDNVERSGGYNYQPGFPEVRVVTAGIVDEITDSTKITLAAEIVYSSLVFKKTDDLFSAQIVAEVQILDLINPDNIVEIYRYPININESSSKLILSQESFLLEKEFPIPPSEYEIIFTVTDLSNNKQTATKSNAFIPNPNEEISHITNIRVFAKEERLTNSFSPITTYDISNQADSIKFEFQLTNNYVEKPITIKSRLIQFISDTTISRPMSFPNYNTSHIAYKGLRYNRYEEVTSSSRVITQSGSVSIEFLFPNLPRGNYRFEVTSDSPDNELFKARDFSVKSINYPSLKTARELAAPLYYLMDKKEYNRLMAIGDEQQLKLAIDKFWLKNIKNSRKAQNVIALYYERVEEANKQFSNFKEGWKTDMGRIYILFGPPWYTNSSLDQVKWSYSHNLYEFESNFFFQSPRMKNPSFPFDSYLFLRNYQYFSIEYQQVQKWLSGSILRDNL